MTRTLRAAALAALLGAVPAAAHEYTRFAPLFVTPAGVADGGACGAVALMSLPPVWMPGDAAVVLLTTAPLRDAMRDPLVAMLLHEQAAVVELVSGLPPLCDADREATLHLAPPADAVAELLGALRAVTREAGAGMVVAIGYGPGARVALAAASDAVAARHLGPGGPRFAAAAALGDGTPAFVLGGPQADREGAAARLGVLCDALAALDGGMGGGGRSGPVAALAACRAALGADAAAVRAAQGGR